MAARILPAEQGLAEAAARLGTGQLVAFPTETVYGLGANALDSTAVAEIFAAKGRPATNPLIVHVATIDAARALSSEWTPAAEALAERFWPGPLTIVVRARESVSPLVRAGGKTVGIRIPAHPVALALLRETGLPIAAPSANRSEEVSPTTAAHVAESLGPYWDDLLILNGGASNVGLESTVVDATGPRVRILRPGMVTSAQIAEALGESFSGAVLPSHNSAEPARSPGQMARHYAPRATVTVVSGELSGFDGGEATDAALVYSHAPSFRGRVIVLPRDAAGYANQLYAALRELDGAGVRRLYIEEPPHGAEWEAIHDRLRRAATPKAESGTG